MFTFGVPNLKIRHPSESLLRVGSEDVLKAGHSVQSKRFF